MRLISYDVGGCISYGAITAHGVLDLPSAFGADAVRYPDLKSLLTGDGLARAAAAVAAVPAAKALPRLEDLSLLPVIPNPGKIVCVGLNYAEHVRETHREVTEKPVLFLRTADSQVGHRRRSAGSCPRSSRGSSSNGVPRAARR